jgi:hypothetical protein
MKEPSSHPRTDLIRRSLVFQLKLLADGLRDFILLPVSLLATLVGLLRGGDDPQREYDQVQELGRRSERWIDLFGTHAEDTPSVDRRSLDGIISGLEDTMRQQAKEGSISESAQHRLEKVLEALQRKVRDP